MGQQVGSILDEIAHSVLTRVNHRKQRIPIESLHAQINEQKNINRISLAKSLLESREKFSVIAEIKRASPSQGDFAMDKNHIEVGRQYHESGAAALSVLTEADYFKGDITFISDLKSVLPDMCILQKDFILDEYQVFEAFLSGADAILLIMAMIGPNRCDHLYKLATSLSMSVLVEVHSDEELHWALDLGCNVIGINSRNLHDFSISHDTIISLSKTIPDGRVVVAESGICKHEDLNLLSQHNCHGFLVGTTLMKSKDPGFALRKLING